MSEQVKISNPIKIQDDSDSRVAFDLMQFVANAEREKDMMGESNPRDYYLTLYQQCLRVVKGKSPFAQTDQ